MRKKIKFGIRFKGMWESYTAYEVSLFAENAEGISSEDLRLRYVNWLENEFLQKQVTPSSLVDADVLDEFQQDIDNRGIIDTTTDFGQDYSDLEEQGVNWRGGEYFLEIAKKLRSHLEING
mgnify:CR=1 FL=1|tara:strand:- start:583 stop:945 length:363 start_codon:yes stop_codon:yes gene_type:complete